jgi:hypothetical protein
MNIYKKVIEPSIVWKLHSQHQVKDEIYIHKIILDYGFDSREWICVGSEIQLGDNNSPKIDTISYKKLVQSTISLKETLRWVPIWNSNNHVKECEKFLLEPHTIDSLEIWMAKRMFWLQIKG